MSKTRFHRLYGELCAAGVGARHARRAVAELTAHYWQLVDAARARGVPLALAREQADQLIGSDTTLVARYASRPELGAFSHHRPLLAFSVIPALA